MKNRIKKQAIEWYNKNSSKFEIDEFVEMIIDTTTDELLEQIHNELNQEFEVGNLKQPLSISNEYYLTLKMKDIKNQITKPADKK